MSSKPIIAVIGTRGPCAFGGVETFVQELYPLLSEDFDITVYCREPYISRERCEYRGVKLCHLPTLNDKHLEAFIHSFLSTVHAMWFLRAQVLHFHAQGPGLFSWLPRLLTPWKKVVYTCHGLDWQRAKWNRAASEIIRLGEWVSARAPHLRTMTAPFLVDYYQQAHGSASVFIPNGVREWGRLPAKEIGPRFGLESGKYMLFVGRLVPEKAVHEVIEAFSLLNTEERRGAKLALVGDSSATAAYAQQIRQMAAKDADIVMTGFCSGDLLNEIYSHATCFVSATHLESISIAQMEAMANGLPCLLSDFEGNRAFLYTEPEREKPFLRYFSKGDTRALADQMREMLAMDATSRLCLGEEARAFVARHFRWEPIARQYAEHYWRLLASLKE